MSKFVLEFSGVSLRATGGEVVGDAEDGGKACLVSCNKLEYILFAPLNRREPMWGAVCSIFTIIRHKHDLAPNSFGSATTAAV